jgi:serine/threonine protein kinase/uncharacterized protein (UPF0147 family)
MHQQEMNATPFRAMLQPLRFAHFEVLTRSNGSPHVLGHGAMGTTYKALDQNLLSLAVIKVPAPEQQAIPSARQRFLQEAQMMARLRHPHVANVFFFGDSSSGAFYAMDFCEGPNLKEYVSKFGALDWQDAFQLALQAADALQALDEHDLVHRDLKPSNIMLTKDSANNAHLKLIDFGAAREGLPSDRLGLTQGGFIGTPAYASPEQFLEAPHLDARSDLYSLGAVLWFCLTGKPPFKGTQFEVMFHHVNTEPDWKKLPAMPEAALALLRRLLAKIPKERPSSPAVLVKELQTTLGGVIARSMHLRATGNIEADDLGGYEPLLEAGADGFGRVWRARDMLTSRIVALRLLPPEFSSKPALVLRAQRLVACVRPFEHPRWQQVWHFEQSGSVCRLAAEWVEGPTTFGLMKVRQTLPLADALPLLAQFAEAMDFATSQGLMVVETAPERLPIQVKGWAGMQEDERSRMLRQPLSKWPEWSVKVCPLYLSMAARDYMLPTDIEAGQAISRIATDFVVLCYRLLTGQAKGTGSWVPSPALSQEGNRFFENSLSVIGLGVSCQHLLHQLCNSEGMQPPTTAMPRDLGDPANIDEGPTLVSGAVGPDTIGEDPTLLSSVVPPATIGQNRALSRGEAVSGTMRSAGVKPNVAGMRSPLGGAVVPRPALTFRLRELEQRRAQLEAEADRLKTEERIEIERDWLVHEREVLAKDRREFAAQESDRARRGAQEQKRIEEQRRALAQQQALLEVKRQEQQRLEKEIQLRAQMEFQKLQEEAKNREIQWQHRRAEAEQALHQREADFRAREQESLARLEALKSEAAGLEASVRVESLSLRKTELAQNRRNQQDEAVGGLAEEELAAEERRLDELRNELDARLAQWQQVQRKRVITLSIGTLLAVLLAGIVAFYMKGRVVDFRTLPGHEQWQIALKERDRAKAEGRWSDLLNWCVATNETLRARPEFAETLKQHQNELASDAARAIAGLVEMQTLPDADTDAGHKLLLNVEKTREWNLPDARLLLLAKLRMREASARGGGEEALQSYLNATNADPSFALKLREELQLAMQRLREQFRSGKLEASAVLLQMLEDIAKRESNLDWSEAERFRSELLVEQARRSGHPEEALRLLLDAARTNPEWTESLRPQAVEIIAQIAALPKPSILPIVGNLLTAGDTWKLPDAYLTLAGFETDREARLDYYQRADNFGSMRARALVGRTLLDTGERQNNPALTKAGEAKLREAIAAADTEAMVLLGEALYVGRCIPENADEAFKLAKMAESQGHPEAFFLAAKAQLRLAEISRDPNQFAEAATNLEKAVSKNLPSAAYFLYIALYNDTVKIPDRAVAALEKGVVAGDKNCLFTLGLWHIAGQSPVTQNITCGRALIEEAASLGHAQAKEWLRRHP